MNVDETEGKALTLVGFLMELPLFDNLTGNELNILADRMNFFEMKKGEILFREGEKGDSVCYVVEGTLEVLKESRGGQDVVIATIGRKRSIGEMALIDHTPRSATVRARTDVTLMALTRKGFNDILEKYPQTGISILKGLARLLSMNLRKTSSRLADYLLPLS